MKKTIKMDAARLNEKITIKTVTNTNSFGDLISSESVLTETMATVTHNTTANDDGVIYDIVNFYIRYFPSISYTCLIYYDNEAYRIVGIKKVGRNEALSLDTIRIEHQ
ncbi:MAG TPA: head-tail adaptor protein [Candidatus Dojkabacteria bacterium]|nr:head-tail adaptor protein [Candidatus Dojkabacteria bacterium]